MDFSINGHALTTGSISTGTLKPENLIKTFSEEIKRLSTRIPDIVSEAEYWLKGPTAYSENHGEGYLTLTVEQVHEVVAPDIVNDLLEHLERMAPDSIEFGAHPGDASDFSWWKVEASEDDSDE